MNDTRQKVLNLLQPCRSEAREAVAEAEQEVARVTKEAQAQIDLATSLRDEAMSFHEWLEAMVSQAGNGGAKPSAKKFHVMHAVRQALRDNPDGIDCDDLRPFIKGILCEDYVLTGSLSRLNQWLSAAPDIVVAGDKYVLHSAAPKQGEDNAASC